jgi:hypothetical protein
VQLGVRDWRVQRLALDRASQVRVVDAQAAGELEDFSAWLPQKPRSVPKKLHCPERTVASRQATRPARSVAGGARLAKPHTQRIGGITVSIFDDAEKEMGEHPDEVKDVTQDAEKEADKETGGKLDSEVGDAGSAMDNEVDKQQ